MTKQEKQKALDKIAKQIENCKICKQGKIGKAVPGEGDADADIVFIGEAPGKNEAKTGRPFIGRAGKLLRSLIKEVGLKDEEVFITSPVKYLPEYVTPTLEDIEHGRIHLFKQFDVIEPKIVVLMGSVAVKAVLGTNAAPAVAKAMAGKQAVLKEKFFIGKDHGKIIKKDGITYIISYHPAAPLYNPNLREDIKKDFYMLKKIIHKK